MLRKNGESGICIRLELDAFVRNAEIFDTIYKLSLNLLSLPFGSANMTFPAFRVS